MRTAISAMAALVITACAIGPDPQETQAVYDYIAANELNEVDRMPISMHTSYTYLSDRFVVIPGRGDDHLLEFSHDCNRLRRTDWTFEMVDRRDNTNVLRTKTDTIRGCIIGRMYEITDAQRKELMALGDAPGDEVYIPDEKD